MIDKMPKAEDMAAWCEKWIEKGLCTDPCPRNEEDVLTFCHKVLDRPTIKKVIWADGPRDTWSKVIKQTIKERKLKGKDAEAVKEYLQKNFIWAHFQGQFEVSWFAHFSFMEEHMGVTGYPEEYHIALKMLDYGPLYPLDEAIVVCDRMSKMRMREVERGGERIKIPHADGAPSIEYRDGSKLYHLNGVSVPEWLVMTPEGELDAKKFAEIDNVEVRREFIRKMGVERIIDHLDSKLLDSKDEYELYEVNLGNDIEPTPVLKMENPSLQGVFHMEFVPRGTKTVAEAIKARNGSDLTPKHKS